VTNDDATAIRTLARIAEAHEQRIAGLEGDGQAITAHYGGTGKAWAIAWATQASVSLRRAEHPRRCVPAIANFPTQAARKDGCSQGLDALHRQRVRISTSSSLN
jgi:hypothetical protein